MIRKYELNRFSPKHYEVRCSLYDVDSIYVATMTGLVMDKALMLLEASAVKPGFAFHRELIDFISKVQSIIAGNLTVDYLNGVRYDDDGLPFN